MEASATTATVTAVEKERDNTDNISKQPPSWNRNRRIHPGPRGPPCFKHSRMAWLESLWVHPSHQNQGYTIRLQHLLIQVGTEKNPGLQRVWYTTAVRNGVLIRLAVGCGIEEVYRWGFIVSSGGGASPPIGTKGTQPVCSAISSWGTDTFPDLRKFWYNRREKRGVDLVGGGLWDGGGVLVGIRRVIGGCPLPSEPRARNPSAAPSHPCE